VDSIKDKLFSFAKNKCCFSRIGKGFANLFQKNFFNGTVNKTDLDKQLVYSLSKSKFPSLSQAKYIGRYLTTMEKRIIQVCLVVFLASASFLAVNFLKNHLMLAPQAGGEYIEGIIGYPKLINPLYSQSNSTDADLASLVYSSLFRRDKNGNIINDLVSDYQVSEDGKTYTVSLKEDVGWHNDAGTVKADDVVFTFSAIKDPAYRSPLRSSFNGVEIEKIDDKTIKFILAEPYSGFINLLNFGIMPSEIWSVIPAESTSLAELNLKPIGSGPYQFESYTKDKNGAIKSMVLVVNHGYYLGAPYIEKLTFKFYPGWEEALAALSNNEIDGLNYLAYSQKEKLIAKDSMNIHKLSSSLLTAVFFNLKDNLVKDKAIRQALATALDKSSINNSVYQGEYAVSDSPILLSSFAYSDNTEKYAYNPDAAGKLLEKSGWKIQTITEEDVAKAETENGSEDETVKNNASDILTQGPGSWLYRMSGQKKEYLKITLTSVEVEDNLKILDLIKASWEKIGVKTELRIIPASSIQNEVIKSRNFQALYYGQMLGGDPDPYSYWHSSQAAKGQNITGYANKDVDAVLEAGRLAMDLEKRKEQYAKFQELITKDVPAIFMFSPNYLYIHPKKIKGFNINNIISPEDRFDNIIEWYIKTGKKIVW
jgi:peptide/nickel transport system substrate-binding protein